MATSNKKLSKRTIALIWAVLVAIVIGVMIKYELISVLYVLATLSLVALLVIVGVADLEKVRADGSTIGEIE